MTCWASSSNKGALSVALLLAACAQARPRASPAALGARSVAVLPLSGLSGGPAPLKDVRSDLESALRQRGVAVVPALEVEEFLARHRLRWTGGVNADSAEAARRELGASALLIAAVDLYQPNAPPRFGLRARLISTFPEPRVLWADAVALTGDEAPGLFDLGLVSEVQDLQSKAVARLSSSLGAFLAGSRARGSACSGGGRFAPQVKYRSSGLKTSGASIVVLPFVNETSRRNAGDLVALEFLRKLTASGVQVVEPGLARDELLKFRLVTDQGISLDTARVVMELLEADFVLTGTVRDFQDPSTSEGDPVVQFTVLMLDRKNDEVVWHSSSYHRGGDGVLFFDAGRVGSVLDLTCRMVASTVEPMLQGAKPASAAQPLREAGGR
jgi:TolB-like protein